MRFATSVLELMTRLPSDKLVTLALVLVSVETVPLVEVRLVSVPEELLRVVIPALVLVSVVMVADAKVALLSDKLETVRLDTDRLVIEAEVDASVATVPLVAVKLVSVPDPLVSVVMSALP